MSDGRQCVCESQIEAVEVFARGAMVTRRVHLPDEAPAGRWFCRLEGLSVLAEPGSFRVALEGAPGRRVQSVRVAPAVSAVGAAPSGLHLELEALRGKVAALEAELAFLSEQWQRLGDVVLEPGYDALRGAETRRAMVHRGAETLATSKMLAERLAVTADAQAQVRRSLSTAREALFAAEVAWSQADAAHARGADAASMVAEIELVGDGPLGGVCVSYAVGAARWWPRYTLRLDGQGRQARWRVEALVAQDSGEDWRGVALSLSTADLAYDARLPVLPSLKLGRANPRRRAHREAPEGLDALFTGYDRASVRSAPPERAVKAWPALARPVEAEPEPSTSTGAGYVEDDAPEVMAEEAPRPRKKAAPRGGEMARGAMPGAPMMQASLAPAARKSVGAFSIGSALAQRDEGYGGAEGGGEAAQEEALALEPSDAWMMFDQLEVRGPDDAARRGRLVRRDDGAMAVKRAAAVARVEGVEVQAGMADPRASRGLFDHRYSVEGIADVPADALLHGVSLGEGEGAPVLRWRSLPRERAEVFREAELRNPLDVPLLAGPVEVFLDGALLAVSEVERVDRGGTIRVGMGVESRLRIARNVRVQEESVGLLGGDTAVTHTVSVEVASSLGQPALVDVLDRVPVSDEKGVEVVFLGAKPECEVYLQGERGAPIRGGRRWQLIVPAGGRSAIEFSYRVSFASKFELVGGNRRD